LAETFRRLALLVEAAQHGVDEMRIHSDENARPTDRVDERGDPHSAGDAAPRHPLSHARPQGGGEMERLPLTIIEMLSARGIDVPEDVRARIVDCTDLNQLNTWVDRAATANSIEDLFE
jgi:hypothetical protein